ncbi:hypothetical protein M8J77_006110 [Diaphorina citri]|nr:hypothetical protein M8J77_006110 [Diaphorina citri]
MICANCKDEMVSEDSVKCYRCENTYHYFCVGLGDSVFRGMNKKKFECSKCKSKPPQIPANAEEFKQGKKHNSTFKMENEEKSYFDMKFQHMENRMTQLTEELKSEFNKRLEVLENQLREKNQIIEDLRNEVDELEMRSRICNIEIRGVPESRNEDVKAIVERVGEMIGINEIREGDIQVAHRVFSKKSNGPKPIIAQLGSRFMKNKWISAYKQLKASRKFEPILASELHESFAKVPFYVYEHMTTKRKMLLAETRAFAKQANLKYVWTKEGAIFVREEERAKVHKVTNAKHVEELKRVFRNKVAETPGGSA